MIAARIRSMAGAHWLLLFGVVLGAWIALYAMAIPADLRAASRIFGAEFWEALCTVTPDLAGFGRVVLMWVLMTAAMMLPTILPAIAAYDDLSQAGATVNPVALGTGYLVVWFGFAVAAAGLQMALFRYDLVSGFGDSRSAWLSAGLLAIAGGYQFSALKESCLSKCRAPVTFFIAHWDAGPFGMGLRLGAVCLGCCWALMLLAFVGGVMSLAFMGIATLIMTLEKLPDIGRWLNRPLGILLLAGAALTAATGL